MNDVYNDLRTLKRMDLALQNARFAKDKKARAQAKVDLQFLLAQMIVEKKTIIEMHEKQAPKDIQELCEYIRNPKGLKYTDKGDLQWAK
tara:strand:+ start:276 stop:542 length:267 start_codon:yes stop_codon:yes gene_type:complete